MISVVTGEDIDKVMDYITEVPDLNFGRRLGWYVFARILKPEIIVETGVDKGKGTMLLYVALAKNENEGYPGQYFGTDINPKAGGGFKFSSITKILYGDSIESLSRFTENIDLFIHDSNHSPDYEYREYRTIEHLITEKTIILSDNSHCTDKLAVFSKENKRRFLYFQEEPEDHWYPGGGIGISYKSTKSTEK